MIPIPKSDRELEVLVDEHVFGGSGGPNPPHYAADWTQVPRIREALNDTYLDLVWGNETAMVIMDGADGEPVTALDRHPLMALCRAALKARGVSW